MGERNVRTAVGSRQRTGNLRLGAYSGLDLSLLYQVIPSGCFRYKLLNRCVSDTDGVNCHVWIAVFIKL